MKRIFSLLLLCSLANVVAWAAPSQATLHFVKAKPHHAKRHHPHKAGHHKQHSSHHGV